MTADPDAALPYDIPDCHCQHVTGGRCMFAATASPGLDVERLARAHNNVSMRRGEGHGMSMQHWAEVACEYAALAADRETP